MPAEDQYALKLLDIYIANAWRIFDEGFGCDRAESAMFAVIDFLCEREGLRPDFLRRVEATLTQADGWGSGLGDVPRELIELPIHELQWPEFRDLIDIRRSLFALDLKYESFLDAFEPDWVDREYYKRYSIGAGRI